MDNYHSIETSINYKWLVLLLHEQGHKIGLESMPTGIAEAWNEAAEKLNVSLERLGELLSHRYDLEYISDIKDDYSALALVPEHIARQYHIYPVGVEDQALQIATSDPFDTEMLMATGFVAGMKIEPCIAIPENIEHWITDAYAQIQTEENQEDDGFEYDELKFAQNMAVSKQVDESAIPRLVNKMLKEALLNNASDIHIEPFVGGGVVRYRVDGILRRITTLPSKLFARILRRFKALGRMDVTNHLQAQDGHAQFTLNKKRIDLRLSTVPVRGGEKIVIRLLNQGKISSIDELGIAQPEVDELKELLGRTNGVVIMTGPTGSGKTTTLYSALAEINTFDRCIMTVEDPVEYEIQGIGQISVNPAQSLTFANALRALMRQDPDVILVGEIRDEETADIAIRAAMTGHFVLTTLHTRDVATVITRLADLDVMQSMIADSVVGLAAQRLVRRLCDTCAEPIVEAHTDLEKKYYKVTRKLPALRAVGCSQCNYSGYSGRIPLLQIVTIDESLADLIRNESNLIEFRKAIRKRHPRVMGALAQERIDQGQTTVDEVFRVLGVEFWQDIIVDEK